MYLLVSVLFLHGPVPGAAHDACVRREVANRYPQCKSNPLLSQLEFSWVGVVAAIDVAPPDHEQHGRCG